MQWHWSCLSPLWFCSHVLLCLVVSRHHLLSSSPQLFCWWFLVIYSVISLRSLVSFCTLFRCSFYSTILQKTFGWKRSLNFSALIKVCKQKFTSLANEHLSEVRDGPFFWGGEGNLGNLHKKPLNSKKNEKPCKGSCGEKLSSECFLLSKSCVWLKRVIVHQKTHANLKVRKKIMPQEIVPPIKIIVRLIL